MHDDADGEKRLPCSWDYDIFLGRFCMGQRAVLHSGLFEIGVECEVGYASRRACRVLDL